MGGGWEGGLAVAGEGGRSAGRVVEDSRAAVVGMAMAVVMAVVVGMAAAAVTTGGMAAGGLAVVAGMTTGGMALGTTVAEAARYDSDPAAAGPLQYVQLQAAAHERLGRHRHDCRFTGLGLGLTEGSPCCPGSMEQACSSRLAPWHRFAVTCLRRGTVFTTCGTALQL